MKTFDIDVHFDASITMHGIIAESEEQAREIARQRAKEMNLFCAAMKRQDAGEEVTECHELTAQELRRLENEKVRAAAKSWFDSYKDPLDKDEQKTLTAVAYGRDTILYLTADRNNPEKWESCLMKSINDGTHPRTAIFERYARMYARRRLEQVADDLRAQWAKAFSRAKADPETYRVIVVTNEADPTAPANEFGRYYMVDGSESESCIEHAGQWVVIRSDVVTSPYEVHRPNWANTHGYADSWTQLTCRCENPNNVTRWARKMIDAGRVTDIYADCY